MANYGLLGGLGEALEGFGKIGLKQWSDQQDEAADERKAQLKAKLEMDLMKAKYDFMKTNPQYKQFFTDMSGNRIGIDQFGHESTVHQATADEAADAKSKREADINYRNAAANAANATANNKGSLDEIRAGLLQAQTDNAHAQADKARRSTTKGPADKYAKTDMDLRTIAMKYAGIDPAMFDPNDPEDQKALAGGMEKAKAMGYHLIAPGGGGGSASNFGVFSRAPGLSGGGGILNPSGMQDHIDGTDYDPSEDPNYDPDTDN